VMIEKAVLLLGRGNPAFSVIRTTCEMLDTADAETKIFQFREDCKWGENAYGKPAEPREVRVIVTYTFWKNEWEIGEVDGRYRVLAILDAPPGYRAVFEATTKPEVVESPKPTAGDNDGRCKEAIMRALDSGRLTIRDLKRKTHADRFPRWDDCLQKLASDGELTLTTESKRTWVELSPS
jgi:hypothetical protein